MAQWEYAYLRMTSSVTFGRISWNATVSGGPHSQLIAERLDVKTVDPLEWCNWLGSQGWELVNTDIGVRYAIEDARQESFPSAFRFFFKRQLGTQ